MPEIYFPVLSFRGNNRENVTHLTAELLNLVEHLIQIFIKLFKLKHRGCISLLEVKVNRQRVRLLKTKSRRLVRLDTRISEHISSTFSKVMMLVPVSLPPCSFLLSS